MVRLQENSLINENGNNSSDNRNFLSRHISGDLEEIPGIGPANKKILQAVGFSNTYQLIGKFLILESGSNTNEMRFYKWLKQIRVNAGRILIDMSIKNFVLKHINGDLLLNTLGLSVFLHSDLLHKKWVTPIPLPDV